MPEQPRKPPRPRCAPGPPVGDDDAPPYAELEALSCFSFLRATSHPEQLVARAVELGYRALALTDDGTLSGVVRAHVAAKDQPLHLIVGARLDLEDGLRVVLHAKDRRGYGHLARLITTGRRRAQKGSYTLRLRDVLDHAEGLLLTVSDTPAPTDVVQQRASRSER